MHWKQIQIKPNSANSLFKRKEKKPFNTKKSHFSFGGNETRFFKSSTDNFLTFMLFFGEKKTQKNETLFIFQDIFYQISISS